jgi:hypothetical protein
MMPGRLSKLMRAGGILSIVSGSLHLAGSTKDLANKYGGYLERGPYLYLIGLLLISSGLTAAWAAGGVREGARWARGATAIAAFQALGLSAILAPGFVVHLSALSVAPVIVAGAHALFLWLVFSRRPWGQAEANRLH